MSFDRCVQDIEMNHCAPLLDEILLLGLGVPRNAIGSDMQPENCTTLITNLNYSKVYMLNEQINAINFMLELHFCDARLRLNHLLSR